MKHLNLVSKNLKAQDTMLCIALCHNERIILQEFLDHYRSFGNISFLIVDDRSNDGSKEFLLDQSDVTLFRPSQDSSYMEHKRYWRQELLDEYGDGKWCFVPDIDEHFVYMDMEIKPLLSLISEIECEGAQAMHGIMLDMYGNRPIFDHIYLGGGLHASFPFFDGPQSYWVMSTPTGFRSKFPTPAAMVFGGMRERFFYSRGKFDSVFREILSYVSPLPFQVSKNWRVRCRHELVRRLVYHFSDSPEIPPLNSSKLPLVKWKKGYFFNGGAHALNKALPIYSQSAALLHYRFTRGVEGLRYSAMRGQHAEGGAYCAKMLDGAVVNHRSPVCAQSMKFLSSASLLNILY